MPVSPPVPKPRDCFHDTLCTTDTATGMLRPLPNVRVYVYYANTERLADIYADYKTTTAISQPYETGVTGGILFYADVGEYEIRIEDTRDLVGYDRVRWNAVNTSPGGVPLFSLGEDIRRQFLQIGQVIDWWRPEATVPLPSGCEVCDGRTIPADEHDFGTGKALTLPDLRNAFILGADVQKADGVASGNGDGSALPGAQHPYAPGIGGTGGSNASVNLGHTHEFTHYHSFTAPNHTHNGSTQTHWHTADGLYTGNHNHTVPESTTPGVGPMQYDATPDQNPTYVANLHHVHTTYTQGNIGVGGVTGTTGALALTTAYVNESLASNTEAPNTTTTQGGGTLPTAADLRPKHVGLLKLMKVRRN